MSPIRFGEWELDIAHGFSVRRNPAHGMHTPVRHVACGHVFDLILVEREHRFEDADTFYCPGCRALADTRTAPVSGIEYL